MLYVRITTALLCCSPYKIERSGGRNSRAFWGYVGVTYVTFHTFSDVEKICFYVLRKFPGNRSTFLNLFLLANVWK